MKRCDKRPRRVRQGTTAGVIRAIVALLALASIVHARHRTGPRERPPIDSPEARSYTSFFGKQRRLTAESAEWRVRLARWEPARWPPHRFFFSVKNRRMGAEAHFSLSNTRVAFQPLQIDELALLRQDRLLVLGRVGANYPTADLLHLPSGVVVDHFLCYRPALSVGRRFLAFVKPFPGHPGPVTVSNEYLAYDLYGSPAYNRRHPLPGIAYDAGWPVYPPGATNAPGSNLVPGLKSPGHEMGSDGFFWLSGHTVAFADRWHDVNSLVVANLTAGIHHPRVSTRKIKTSSLVDFAACSDKVAPSDLERWKKDPGILIYVRGIQKLAAKPGWVRLALTPNPCLSKTTLDLPIGRESKR